MQKKFKRDIAGYYIPEVDEYIQKLASELEALKEKNEKLKEINIVLEGEVKAKNNRISKLENELLKAEIKINGTQQDND
ncbi:cell division protein GpsB [Mycoplasmopsis californica]|uniref:DivIVA domain-containing protein n=1 Tax=Mycoplasmopsis equigenitalium TaxID=114883 RepID=A0ABY5J162_9BACT|nr:DivIVA domain-containing protein [Mycoplasmopsis equigenitalium]UUD36995.1 DivIVA domain-containing protein [Mycoplasmopsis equigenitalium]VEU69707.1 cell division protein GpsB [Mycoplasmopsis californica]